MGLGASGLIASSGYKERTGAGCLSPEQQPLQPTTVITGPAFSGAPEPFIQLVKAEWGFWGPMVDILVRHPNDN